MLRPIEIRIELATAKVQHGGICYRDDFMGRAIDHDFAPENRRIRGRTSSAKKSR